MCGRYVIYTQKDIQEMMLILQEVENKYGSDAVKTGEIFPQSNAPVFVGEEGRLGATVMQWGFPKYQGSGVIINARSETAIEKRTFKTALMQRRCVIPTTVFFEWKQEDGQKTKFVFNIPDSPMVYLAGLYSNDNKYVILTTDANASMKPYHHRMPLILPKGTLENWVYDTDYALDYLHRVPPNLTAKPA